MKEDVYAKASKVKKRMVLCRIFLKTSIFFNRSSVIGGEWTR